MLGFSKKTIKIKTNSPSSLFRTNSNYRENKTIWRVFETALFSCLTDGSPWNWFAVNIPMDVFPEISGIKGDIDIINKIWGKYDKNNNEPPPRFRAWEVKTILLDKNNNPKSLKRGKTNDLLKQLDKLREFGISEVGYFEVYILEDGYISKHNFPAPEVKELINEKINILKNKGYGYEILPFEHYEADDLDVGLKTVYLQWVPPKNSVTILSPKIDVASKTFECFVKKIDDFYNEEIKKSEQTWNNVVTYCKKCKKLILINPHISTACKICNLSVIDMDPCSVDTSFYPICHTEIVKEEQLGFSEQEAFNRVVKNLKSKKQK